MSLAERLEKLAYLMMSSTEFHKYARTVFEAVEELKRPLPEGDARDAARYRWLRDKSLAQFKHPIVVSQERSGDRMDYRGPVCLERLDELIDAALRDSSPPQNGTQR